MHLKSLKVFCDVVARRSFSRAAIENNISQSGASQVVHQLEERLGARLIDRSKRPFVLTDEGRAFYDGCRKIVQNYFDLEEQIRSLHEDVAGRVVVASIYSVGLHHMNRYLKEFLSAHPKANIRLEYLHPQRVYDAVEEDNADLGLVSYPRSSRTLGIVPWRTEPMVLACAPDHELAGRASISLKALHGHSMVRFESGLVIRREIDRALQSRRVETKIAMEFDNIETIKRAVEIGAGVSLLPEPTVTREVESGTLVKVPLDEDDLVRPLGIVYRRGKQLSATAHCFRDLLTAKAAGDEAFSVAAGETTAASNGKTSLFDADAHQAHSHQDEGHASQNGERRGDTTDSRPPLDSVVGTSNARLPR